MDPSFIPYRVAASYLKQRLEQDAIAKQLLPNNNSNNSIIPLPLVGIICGSGLSELARAMQDDSTLTIPYSDIPGFPSCTVSGHQGQVVFGTLSSKKVPTICFRGRFHFYEGHDMKTVVLPVYVMRCLGVKVVIVTNAAGGLNPEYRVGNVVCVSDHLAIPQLAGKNPLIGPNDDELGPRFPATSDAYPDALRKAAHTAASELLLLQQEHGDGQSNSSSSSSTMDSNFLVPHGTYCFVSGPMYESKAECRLLRSLGGDLVGMSTVPEVVAAHHCNMQILCLSLVTNLVIMTGDEGRPVASHAEVLEAVQQRSTHMQALVQHIVLVLKRDDILDQLPNLPNVNLQVVVGPTVAAMTSKEEEDELQTMTKARTGAHRSSSRQYDSVPTTTNHSAKLSLPHSLVLSASILAIGIVVGARIIISNSRHS